MVTGEGNGPVNGISGVSPLIKHMCVRLNNLEGEENKFLRMISDICSNDLTVHKGDSELPPCDWSDCII